jgi:hypothetical protein
MNKISPRFYTGSVEIGLLNVSAKNASLSMLFFTSYYFQSLAITVPSPMCSLGLKNSSTKSFYLRSLKETSCSAD